MRGALPSPRRRRSGVAGRGWGWGALISIAERHPPPRRFARDPPRRFAGGGCKLRREQRSEVTTDVDGRHDLGRGSAGAVRRAGRRDGARPAGGVRVPRAQRAGRMAVPRRRTGTVAACAQRRAVDHHLFADADPVLRADGRGAVPHRRGAQGDRRVRGADPPGAGPARGDLDRRRHGVLGDLGLDHRDHRAARQPDAADHAAARL